VLGRALIPAIMGGSNSCLAPENSSSFSKTPKKFSSNTKDMVKLMLPVYYVKDEVTPEDLAVAKFKWNMILTDSSPYFERMKGSPDYEQSSCLSCFYDSFYGRLFDVHPSAKPMFSSGMKSQGKFLVNMMTMTLNVISNPTQLIATMTDLADRHNARGVKAVEYGIVGEVLFWTLRQCLGPDYDTPTHRAWVRIFCKMLEVLVPLAVAFEMSDGSAQVSRLLKASNAQQAVTDESASHDPKFSTTGGKTGPYSGGSQSVSPSRLFVTAATPASHV